jgi:hypothetical protein
VHVLKGDLIALQVVLKVVIAGWGDSCRVLGAIMLSKLLEWFSKTGTSRLVALAGLNTLSDAL